MLASSMTLTDLKRVARVRQQQLSFLLYYPTIRLWSIQISTMQENQFFAC